MTGEQVTMVESDEEESRVEKEHFAEGHNGGCENTKLRVQSDEGRRLGGETAGEWDGGGGGRKGKGDQVGCVQSGGSMCGRPVEEAGTPVTTIDARAGSAQASN